MGSEEFRAMDWAGDDVMIPKYGMGWDGKDRWSSGFVVVLLVYNLEFRPAELLPPKRESKLFLHTFNHLNNCLTYTK
jgi:hypothetical protein